MIWLIGMGTCNTFKKTVEIISKINGRKYHILFHLHISYFYIMIDIDKLTKEEKIDLWNKLNKSLSDEEIENWQLNEANRRLAAHRNGNDKGKSWDQVKQDVWSKLN